MLVGMLGMASLLLSGTLLYQEIIAEPDSSGTDNDDHKNWELTDPAMEDDGAVQDLGYDDTRNGDPSEPKDAVLTDDEAIAIASADADVAAWCVNIGDDQYVVSAYYDGYGSWYVDFYPMYMDDLEGTWESDPDDQNKDDDDSAVLDADWVMVLIDDETGEILDTLFGESYYDESTMTEDEVLAIVLDHFAAVAFVADYPDAEIWTWYGGCGFWQIQLQEPMTYTFAPEDESGKYLSFSFDEYSTEIMQINSNCYIEGLTTHTVDEITAILAAIPEVSPYLTNENYTLNLDFTWYQTPDGEFATWRANLWEYDVWLMDFGGDWDAQDAAPEDPFKSTNADVWYCYGITVIIDDITGTVLEMWVPREAVLTEAEVIAIAEAVPEIVALAAQYDLISCAYFLEYSGVWEVGFYSEVFWGVYAWVTIDDLTGEVLDVFVELPEDTPTMTVTEVMDIVYATDEYATIAGFEGIENRIGYYEGFWQVDFYSTIFWEVYALFEIDDSTGEIIYSYCSTLEDPPTLTYAEAEAYLLANGEVSAYLAANPDAEYYISYYNGYWYMCAYSTVSTEVLYAWLCEATLEVTVEIEDWQEPVDPDDPPIGGNS